jgi:hypothetical protein
MASKEDILEQQDLLQTHRRTLAIYLKQLATIGGAFAPPVLITNGASCSGGSVDLRKAKPSSTMWVYRTHQSEDGMPTDEIIIRLFCMVDDHVGRVNKRSDAHLYASEIVAIGLLFSLKGGRFRAFYRWLRANYRVWFPTLPERTRLQRLLRDYAGLTLDFLAEPSFFTVVDTYGIELIHPRREGRSKHQIGKKGISNGRWIIGIKLAWLINDQGEVCSGSHGLDRFQSVVTSV